MLQVGLESCAELHLLGRRIINHNHLELLLWIIKYLLFNIAKAGGNRIQRFEYGFFDIYLCIICKGTVSE